MTLLITGATGFIGCHLTATLTRHQHSVLAMLRRPNEQLPQLKQQVKQLGGNPELISAIEGDLDISGLGLKETLPPLNVIIHLGARFGWGLSADEARRTNVQGTLSICDLARQNHCRLVMTGGFMAENQAHTQWLGVQPEHPEQTDWERVYRKVGSYEASKMESVHKARHIAQQDGLDYVEVQPALVAGHSVTGDLDSAQSLFNLFENLYKGRMTLIPGTADHWLPIVAVDHLANLMMLAATVEQVPQRLLALDPDSPNLATLLALAADEFGHRAPRRFIPLALLSLLLKIPGVGKWMNASPESLHFIQTTRFNTNITRHFEQQQGLTRPNAENVIRQSARFYLASRSPVGAVYSQPGQ